MVAKRKFIGYWGCPPRDAMAKASRMCHFGEFIDLDVDMNAPSSGLVPDAYCQIITNIVDNAMYLKDEIRLIVAPVGEDKCDGGRFAAIILKDLGFDVMEVRNTNFERGPVTIATSDLPLIEKADRIIAGVRHPSRKNFVSVPPTHGFWGVPPHDMHLLELFPKTTHVYGWLRCVEAGTPADLDLELFVDAGVATIFFAQTFCQKTSLARYLAEKHNGLYIDCDGPLTNSVIAKVVAFLRLG
jgi:hypothetical protein